MATISLLRGDKVDNNTDYRDSLPVNYYAVLRDIYGIKGYFLNFYGLTSVGNGQGKSRGSIWVARPTFEGHYRVSGTSLIKIESNGSITVLGDIPGSDQVSLTYSLNNLAIVADKRLYYYNPTDGLRQITDTDIGDIIDIVWADFRFIATDGEFLFQSNIANEEEYEPLDFVGSDFQPDKIWGVGLNEDNELIAFGAFTTEYFFNAGTDNFSYVRIPLKAVKSGIVGTHCKIEYKDQWFSLSRRANTQPQFTIIQSGSSDSITSREIEKVLGEYTDEQLSTVTLDFFVKDSIVWFIAHLPNETLAFNYTLSKAFGVDYAWSILKSDVVGDKTFRAKDFTYDPNKSEWIGGDKATNDLGFLDDSVCTQYGNIVEGLLYTPDIDLESLSINKIEIETIPGIAPDNDATVFISRSDDLRVDGSEWTAIYGDNLNYNQRFIIRRMGYVRNKVSFRLRTASRARMSFAKFDLEAS
ncbi:MAG TPA: hypothetical protein EYN67_08425 [Flavobacteriales bacterium]|nr:hypothetical protein [Methylococcaceae bacterium]HHZ95569.1 hypothetical protein [Flavobacteriales bacterium]